MKYLKRFNESISEEECNKILDKIAEFGLSSLNTEELSKLRSFDNSTKEPNKTKYNKIDDKVFFKLYEDSDVIVSLKKHIVGLNIIYYIFFKNLPDDCNIKSLKLSYNLNKVSRGFYDNFIIHDTNNNVIDFGKLEIILNRNGLDFGDFNKAWHYI